MLKSVGPTGETIKNVMKKKKMERYFPKKLTKAEKYWIP
jgi:hypothetical protein